MTTYTFKTIKNNNSSNKSNNYSKILDNIIAADIAKKNSYLFNHDTTPSTKACLNTIGIIDTDYIKAANFLANYNTKKTKKLPFIIGKIYELADGTPIIFYDDEIQIGFDLYSYSDFGNIELINAIPAPKKKLIIDIFYKGTNINIKL